MKVKSQRDFGAGLMFVVIGIVFAIAATKHSLGDSVMPGPGYFPLLLGGLLALLGGLLLFKSLAIESERGEPIGPIAWRPLAATVLAALVFGAAMPRFGLLISTPLLIVISSLADDSFRWKRALALSLLLTVLAWAVFVAGLKLPLPVWPLAWGR